MEQIATLLLLSSLVPLSTVNCANPTFTSALSDQSISESVSIGTSLQTVSASDTDGDALTYAVTTGNKFVMDGNVLKTSDTFDYETSSDRSHTVTVRVTDINDNSVSDTMIVTITDADDNAPVFSPSIYTATIAEATSSGTSVVALVCSDADSSSTCSLSIQSGDDTSNKFSISGSTIQTTSNALDYDSISAQNFVYSLVVVATDTVTTSTAYVYVTVTAVNEHTPTSFSTSPASISIAESVSIGTSVCTVSATDADIEPEGVLQYSIISGNTNTAFGIDATSGIIYTLKTLDYDTTTSYTLVVQARDAASSPRSASTNVAITITNVNDNTPSCSPNFAVVSLIETSTAGTTVHTLSCSDEDSSTPSYSITSGNTDSTFSVTSAGVIQIATGKSVDYDSGTTAYTLAVRVSDGTYSTTVTVAVTITASNEATPSFSSNPTQNINEDSSVGTAVNTYTATDSDAAPHAIVSYAITSVTNGGSTLFSIDHSSGAIQLAQTLDYETQTSYLLTVVATDGGSSTGTGTVTVSVNDVNDVTPSCSPNIYALSLAEDTSVSSTVIADLQCTDADSGSNGALSYAMTQNPGSKFSVSAGAVTLSAALDYETTQSYSLQVTVSDGGSPVKSTVIDIEVTVTNVNEDTPTFTSSGVYSINFDENTATATTIVTVSASDTDSGDTISYAFTTTYTGFEIVTATGEILLTRALDYETATTHTLLVTANDGTATVTGTVSLTVNDVNEAPVFASTTYSPSIDENKAVGSSLVQVSATDQDASTAGTVTYSIVSGDGSSYFTIDSSTGIITTSASLNYEEKTTYFLVVRAADGASPSLSASCLVNVTVNDLNDNAPVFSPTTFTLVIAEDISVSSTIRTIAATDADSITDNNNVFEYTLTTNTIPYSLGTTSGEITTNVALDRETTSSYELVIHAIDKGTTALSTTYTLTVTLTDVNDNTPVISGTYVTTISEDTPLNTYLFTVTATDIDEGDNARLTYNINSGDTNNDFTIESGFIFTAKTLDRETTALYSLVIHVTDNGSPSNTATVTATVTITDINDNTPTFTSNSTFDIDEGVSVGTNVATITATDPDDGVNDDLTYSIQSYWSTGTNPFSIDGTTGVITTTSSLDRETLDTYSFLVRVADGGSPSLSSEINITITVNDINDNSPVFGSASYSGSVTEGSTIGTTVMTVSATDADADSNAVFAFTIDTAASGGTSADQYFTLASATGVTTVKQVIDRETISEFSFTIKAIDTGSPALTSTVSVYISVNDINDNIPVFSPTFYDSEISYLVTCRSSITTLSATDADTGDNGAISYYVVQSDNINFDDYFEVGSSTGQLELKSQVTSGTKYLMTFGARDSGSTQQTTSQSATVRVDAYDPYSVVIVFYMSIGLTAFTSLESTFLTQLTSVYQTTYPTSQAKRWCISEESSSTIKVYVYVVQDDTTDTLAETANTKTFLTSTTARDIVASSTGTPGSTITGSTWTAFSITSVVLYGTTVTTTSDASTAWLESATGIGVITGASVGFLILVIITIIVIYKVCKKDTTRSSSKVSVADEADDITSAKSKPVSGKKDLEEESLTSAKSYKKQNVDKFDRDELKSAILYQDPKALSVKLSAAAKGIRTPVHNKPKGFHYPDFYPEKRQPSPEISVSPLPYKVDTDRLNIEKSYNVRRFVRESNDFIIPPKKHQ